MVISEWIGFGLTLLVLYILIYMDARLLARKRPKIYHETLFLPPWLWALITALLYVVAAPVYFFFRHLFKRLLKRRYRNDLQSAKRIYLVSDTLGLILVWVWGLGAIAILNGIVSLIIPGFENGLTAVLIMAVFSFGLMTYLIYRVSRTYTGQGFRRAIAWTHAKQKGWSYGVAALMGIVFALLSSLVIAFRKTQPDTPLSQMLETNTSASALLIFIAIAVLVAPLMEELIFRGFLFGVIKFWKGTVISVVIISALFGLMHVEQYWGDWMAITVVGMLGLCITLLRAWTNSCKPGIVTHYVYNGLVTILPIIIMMISNPSYAKYALGYQNMSYHEKVALLEETIDGKPQFAEAYNDLAWTFAEEGDRLPEALELIDRGLEIEPERGAFQDTKAEILFRMGRVSEAVEIEKSLIERYPDVPFYQQQLERFQNAVFVDDKI